MLPLHHHLSYELLAIIKCIDGGTGTIFSTGFYGIVISVDHTFTMKSNHSYWLVNNAIFSGFHYLLDFGLLFLSLDLHNCILWCNSNLILICDYDGSG